MRAESIDLTVAREFVVGLMPEAGDILKRYFLSNTLRASFKNPRDLVTQADLDADKFLREQIGKRFPKHTFLTEETAPKQAKPTRNPYSYLKNAENIWIIDSLDGTWNFFKGNPNFAISVALVSKGIARIGVVYVPIAEKLYFAQEDLEHTFLNGEQVRGISKTEKIESCSFACDWVPDAKGRQRTLNYFLKVVNKVGPIKSMGSAVADLASILEGSIDAYLNCGLKPWDVAANSIILRKEGVIITTPDGKPWNVFESDIFAAVPILHPKFVELLA